jgi:hypothetical protein
MDVTDLAMSTRTSDGQCPKPLISLRDPFDEKIMSVREAHRSKPFEVMISTDFGIVIRLSARHPQNASIVTSFPFDAKIMSCNEIQS